MKFGLDVPTTGEYADPNVLADLAVAAERAGWDGFFIWDVLGSEHAVIDPWIALTAIALRTKHIRIGTMVTPLARHRPWLVARQLANLDHLSGGRVICAVGLGMDDDFTTTGEDPSTRSRAQALDEALEIVDGVWRSNDYSYAGDFFHLEHLTLLPKPVQTPRIPLWVAGGWPRTGPFRRAARWDGACIKSVHANERRWLALGEVRECVDYIRAQHPHDGFDIIASGELPDEPAEVRERLIMLGEIGATWWCEEGLGWSLEEFRNRIRTLSVIL